MTDHQTTANSLLEIETRQNEVLRKLDELNQRIEQALSNVTGGSHRMAVSQPAE